jgi:hypothetical protein
MSDDDIRFTAKLKGSSDVARLLRRHPEKIARTLESLVKQEARGMAVELARYTRPYGFAERAKKKGEKAVAADIRQIFAVPSAAYEELRKSDPAAAERFWANIQNRRFARAQTALRGSRSAWNDLPVGRLDPSLHQWGRLGGSKPKQIITSPQARESYIAKIQRRVGFAKASWLNAGKAIGGRVRGAAQWATRHKQAPGTATVRTGNKPSVTLINRLDYLSDTSTGEDVRRALRHAAARLRKALSVSLRKMNQRTNQSLRRRSG